MSEPEEPEEPFPGSMPDYSKLLPRMVLPDFSKLLPPTVLPNYSKLLPRTVLPDYSKLLPPTVLPDYSKLLPPTVLPDFSKLLAGSMLLTSATFTPRITVNVDPAIFRARFVMPALPRTIVPDVASYLRSLDVETVEALVEEAGDPSVGDRATELVVSQLLKASDRLTPLMAQCLVASIVWTFCFVMLAVAAHEQPELAAHITSVYDVGPWGLAAPPAGFVTFLLRQWEAQERRRRDDQM